jgi:hypothetical protein
MYRHDYDVSETSKCGDSSTMMDDNTFILVTAFVYGTLLAIVYNMI